MTSAPNSDSSVTALLDRWRTGDRDALERLLPLVYADLRRIAARQLRQHDGHATLQTTALVHDVLLRMLDRAPTDFSSTAHLLNAAARMMRQHLVDRSRAAAASKRGGGWLRDDFTAALDLPIPDNSQLTELDEAISELEQFDPRMAQVVELRYFIGLSVSEIAQNLETSERTIQRDWLLAQAWLRERLGD
jgi:RNA polymerase sigma factor (TIGR02999 family)